MKIAITLEYDGSAFAGWQLQPGQRTVQGEMEKALHCYLRALARQNAIELYVLPHLTASGRTDAGVHALGQTASFSWPAEIPCDLKRLKAALNGLTPRAICLKRVEQRGDQFDARRSPHIKCYTYEIVLERTKGAVAEKRAWCVGVPLRVPQMISAARVFAGAH
ncbi:MAG TPA: tRNA pseudouridine synthase A, partial [Oligoflexia bacterium]|nr:tRNA pseudouridine synthase A [Oligoflexia bacterium]